MAKRQNIHYVNNKEFSQAVVKNWKGLKLKYLEDLILVDLKGQNHEDVMPYSQDNAEVLIENSQEFDNWLNEVVFDLQNFRGSEQEVPVQEVSSPAG